MLLRTHIAVTVLFIILLINYVDDKLVFVLVALVATMLPDIDSRFSSLGKKKPFRLFQIFIKHRGVLHSFTFLILITVVLYFYLPIIGLGFLVGYGSHLLADCFTPAGIKPFYPWKKRLRWYIRTGGRIETVVFVIFLLWDVGLILYGITQIYI